MDLGSLRKANLKLHSKEHLLAEDLSSWMHEPKRFPAYLGIAKMYPEAELRALAKRVLEKKDLPLEARGKYFFASLKNLPKKSNDRNNNRIEKQNIKKQIRTDR